MTAQITLTDAQVAQLAAQVAEQAQESAYERKDSTPASSTEFSRKTLTTNVLRLFYFCLCRILCRFLYIWGVIEDVVM